MEIFITVRARGGKPYQEEHPLLKPLPREFAEATQPDELLRSKAARQEEFTERVSLNKSKKRSFKDEKVK